MSHCVWLVVDYTWPSKRDTHYLFPSVAYVRDQEFCSLVNHHVSYSGFTALHYAVLTEDRAMVEWLLENGADPTVENHRGLKPSDYSTSSEILSLLQEHTAKVGIQ